MTDHADFLSAILADPESDAPRLIFADFLEEEGQSDRADFIRVQCELDACVKCRSRHENSSTIDILCGHEDGHLQRRERKLYDTCWHNDQVSFLTKPLHSMITAGRDMWEFLPWFKRGFVAEVHCTLADWMGGWCPTCNGRGSTSGPFREYRACSSCNGKGKIQEHGPQIVAAQPVEKVVFTDKRPSRDSRTVWSWHQNIPAPLLEEHNLPEEIFSLLMAGRGDSRGMRFVCFNTEQDALDALSIVAISWANSRRQAIANIRAAAG